MLSRSSSVSYTHLDVYKRQVWGIAQMILLGVSGSAFTWQMFLSGAFLNAIPGIVLQLVLIPGIMVVLNRTGLVRFKKPQSDASSATEENR